MLEKAILDELVRIAGEDRVLAAKADLVTYSYDATANVPRRIPDVVVMPASTEEVQKIVNLARENQIAIYPRGAGTNLSGGAIPVRQGIVLSFQRMNKILEIDAENLTATVQPGVVIQELNDAVAPFGLIYPPDPGTVTTATMGGSVAENSGGLRGLKYGVTKHYVMGMEVVLANGETGALRRQDGEERHRLRFLEPLRRIRGHARHHRRDHLQTGARARNTAAPCWPPSTSSKTPATRWLASSRPR